MEFLRTQQHLRPRTNLFRAVFRIRSVAAGSIHRFFQDRGFIQRALRHERRRHVLMGDLVVVLQAGAVHDHLQVLEAAAVVQGD